jgi:hypothetical protein
VSWRHEWRIWSALLPNVYRRNEARTFLVKNAERGLRYGVTSFGQWAE